jgi:NSS family neurotransmitter:Na+ symporter
MDAFDWERRRAALLGGAAVTLAGAWSAYDIAILDLADGVATNLFLVGGGLGIAIFVGWVMEDPGGEAAIGSERSRIHDVWRFLLRFVVPLVLIFILYHSLPETWAKISSILGLG